MEKVLVTIGRVAEIFGVTTQTIRNWAKQGIMKEYRTIGGHRRFDIEEIREIRGDKKIDKKTVIYSRVSSYDQKKDLKKQTKDLENYCEENNIEKPEIIEDIGSGINYKKKGLKRLIKDIILGKITQIIVSYEDRLLRFGIELLKQICKIMEVKIIVVNEKKEKGYQEKLVDDVLAILIVYCSKIYGSRSHKKKKMIFGESII